MFDQNKIINNHRRSLKSVNDQANLFLTELYREALERLEINKIKQQNILEIFARNNLLNSVLKKKYRHVLYQSVISPKIYLNNSKTMVAGKKLESLKSSAFNYIISFFPMLSQVDLINILKSCSRVLSK